MYKKGMSIILVMLMVMGGISGIIVPGGGTAYAAADFAVGAGTKANPFEIATADELNAVRDHLGDYFKLTADINLSSYAWQPIGDQSYPFHGNIDGNDHIITGLTINQPNGTYVGLFGSVGADGSIMNLKLKNVDILGKNSVGGLVGQNYGTISDSYVTGIIQGGTGSRYVGGLVGVNIGTISNSSAIGIVSVEQYGGNLVGNNGNGALISNSHALGTLNGAAAGRLFGYVYNNADISNSFYGWDSVALTPGTKVGTTKLNNVYYGMEYSTNNGVAYTEITNTSVDDIVVNEGNSIRVRAAVIPSSEKIITVKQADIQWDLDSLQLESNAGIVTQGKVKVVRIPATSSTFWATPGQVTAEADPGVGTMLSDVGKYSINLSQTPFVPAVAGNIISVVEVDNTKKVIGYKTIEVATENIGKVLPLVDKENPILQIAMNGSSRIYAGDLYNDAENHGMTIVSVESSKPNVVGAALIPNGKTPYVQLNGVALGTAVVHIDVEDNLTHDKFGKTVHVNVLKRGPYIYNNSESDFVGSASSIEIELPDSEWALPTIEVNDVVVPSTSFSYTPGDYASKAKGKILLKAGVLSAGRNHITVKVAGYVDGETYIDLYNSEDSFYMDIEKTSDGLKASVNVVLNIKAGYYYWGKATVVFQLMNGNVPVKTYSTPVNEMKGFQTFSVDIPANSNYSVRAFIITGGTAYEDNMGYNLAKQVNADDFKQHYEDWWND
ncbi:GLUG motif-containing protein [Paenibacillus baekrokdamisoli]|nr:GLUG motif-containing protein [Paenibacillus baekrokdamisoli]